MLCHDLFLALAHVVKKEPISFCKLATLSLKVIEVSTEHTMKFLNIYVQNGHQFSIT